MAVLAYVAIGAVLGTGMMMAVKGSPWLLVIAFVAYVVAFGKLGCMPPKSSH